MRQYKLAHDVYLQVAQAFAPNNTSAAVNNIHLFMNIHDYRAGESAPLIGDIEARLGLKEAIARRDVFFPGHSAAHPSPDVWRVAPANE
jgi:hypothetical protein